MEKCYLEEIPPNLTLLLSSVNLTKGAAIFQTNLRLKSNPAYYI